MKSFRVFYKERHGAWPGYPSEPYNEIFKRICDAQADYIDEIIAPAAARAANPAMILDNGEQA